MINFYFILFYSNIQLETIKLREHICLDVYSATGSNLNEFMFYKADQGSFMNNFNEALIGHTTYPLG